MGDLIGSSHRGNMAVKSVMNLVPAHTLDLECRFAVAECSLFAAKEAEALLIEHWRLGKQGGTLFNDRTESLPILEDLGDDRRQFAHFNVPAIVPSTDKCLANAELYDTWLARDKEQLDDEDLIVFTGSPSCWRPLHHRAVQFSDL